MYKLFKLQRTTKKTEDISKYKKFKALVQREERQEYWKYVENIIDLEEDGTPAANKQKRFWSFIKSRRKDNVGIAPLKENGIMHADPKDKANILNRQ